jgi:WD40 repeat protein
LKIKTLLTPLLVLAGLAAVATSSYFLGRLFLHFEQVPAPGLPPLSRLALPPQSMNGFTAQVESYYADASRLVFIVRVNSEKDEYLLDSASIKEAQGQEINAGYGVSPYLEPSTFMIDFVTAQPLSGDHLNGQLAIKITKPGDWTPLADFQFDLDIPVHPELTFDPRQTVWANGLEILLDRVVITPSYTHAYLCYIQPTEEDWVISQDTTLSIDSQVANLGTYALLFDKSLGDGSKGGEPGWTPPVQNGRCVKIGFPVGSAQPKSLLLTIPALEQSMPEVIPEEDLEVAYLRLKEQGIDMEWHTVDHGAYPEFKSLPSGMSEEAAHRQFVQALGYIHPGGWIFELPLETEEEKPPKFSTSNYGAATPLPAPSRIKPTLKMDGRIRSFDLHPDQKAIAFATSKGVIVYDFDRTKIRRLNETENVFSIDWSPDGEKLATGGIIMDAPESGTAHLTVWDTSSWKTVFELDSGQRVSIPFGALAWSPDSNLLAAPFSDRGVIVLNIKTGQTVAEQEDLLVPPDDIAWSPDGSRILVAGELAYGFRKWRLDTNEFVRLYDPRAGSAAIRLAWSPDGTRIASGHAGETVCVWTVSTNQCDGLMYAHENLVSGLAWSPDGSQLATGGGVIRIWDSQTGEMIKALGLSDQSIYTHLAWLEPDLLISLETGYASDALTLVRFWDPEGGDILTEFEGQSASFGQ